MDKAVEFLREKGLAAAAKKASRIAAEGIVATLVSDDKNPLLSLKLMLKQTSLLRMKYSSHMLHV